MTKVTIKRVYDAESSDDGYRVLIDRLWPRGVRKVALHYDLWAKELAPSPALREWFHEEPEIRWREFVRCYNEELKHSAVMTDFLEKVRGMKHITLLYASKNAAQNHALILRDFIEEHMV